MFWPFRKSKPSSDVVPNSAQEVKPASQETIPPDAERIYAPSISALMVLQTRYIYEPDDINAETLLRKLMEHTFVCACFNRSINATTIGRQEQDKRDAQQNVSYEFIKSLQSHRQKKELAFKGEHHLENLIKKICNQQAYKDRHSSQREQNWLQGAVADLAAAVPESDDIGQALVRGDLETAWEVIQKLPPQQRTVLLLTGYSDQSTDISIVREIANSRIDTQKNIIDSIDIDPDLRRQIWDKIPMNDREIANLLDLTEAYVPVVRLRARKKIRDALVSKGILPDTRQHRNRSRRQQSEGEQ